MHEKWYPDLTVTLFHPTGSKPWMNGIGLIYVLKLKHLKKLKILKIPMVQKVMSLIYLIFLWLKTITNTLIYMKIIHHTRIPTGNNQGQKNFIILFNYYLFFYDIIMSCLCLYFPSYVKFYCFISKKVWLILNDIPILQL